MIVEQDKFGRSKCRIVLVVCNMEEEIVCHPGDDVPCVNTVSEH